jgi:hypothetical protein
MLLFLISHNFCISFQILLFEVQVRTTTAIANTNNTNNTNTTNTNRNNVNNNQNEASTRREESLDDVDANEGELEKLPLQTPMKKNVEDEYEDEDEDEENEEANDDSPSDNDNEKIDPQKEAEEEVRSFMLICKTQTNKQTNHFLFPISIFLINVSFVRGNVLYLTTGQAKKKRVCVCS